VPPVLRLKVAQVPAVRPWATPAAATAATAAAVATRSCLLSRTCELQDGEVPPVLWLKVAQVPAVRPWAAPAANQVPAPLRCTQQPARQQAAYPTVSLMLSFPAAPAANHVPAPLRCMQQPARQQAAHPTVNIMVSFPAALLPIRCLPHSAARNNQPGSRQRITQSF
jgi:hypothetical protein